MAEKNEPTQPSDPSFKPLFRSLMIELTIYAPLVTGYFLLVILFAKEPIVEIYQNKPIAYAILATIIIVAQGVLLEALTSWLLRKIGLRY
jgi:ABC-type molybdate transport system permease subunit